MLTNKPTVGSIFHDDDGDDLFNTVTGGGGRRGAGNQRQQQEQRFNFNDDSSFDHHRTGGRGHNVNTNANNARDFSYTPDGQYGEHGHGGGIDEDEDGVMTAPLSAAVSAPFTFSSLSHVAGGVEGSPYGGNNNNNGGRYQHQQQHQQDGMGSSNNPFRMNTAHNATSGGGGGYRSPLHDYSGSNSHANNSMAGPSTAYTSPLLDNAASSVYPYGQQPSSHPSSSILRGGGAPYGSTSKGGGGGGLNMTPTSKATNQQQRGNGAGVDDAYNSPEAVAKRLRIMEEDLFLNSNAASTNSGGGTAISVHKVVPVEVDPTLHFRQVAANLSSIPRPHNSADPPWWLGRHSETTATLRRPYAEEQPSYRRAFGGRRRGGGGTMGGGVAEGFAAFEESDGEDGEPHKVRHPIIVQDPVPQGMGMLRGLQDLALPPPKGGGDHHGANVSKMRSARTSIAGPNALGGATFGRVDSMKKGGGSDGTNSVANFELGEDESAFAVEREYRDRHHARLQQVVYPPLRRALVSDELGAGDDRVDEVSEVLRRHRSSAIQNAAFEEERAEREKKSRMHADGGTFVPFSVRPMHHSDLRYSAEDAKRRADTITENNRRRAVEEALDVTTATVVTEPFRPPPRRNLREEEEAKRQLIAFDDDDPFTFKARRLKNTEAIDEIYDAAAHETVERAEKAFQETQDKLFAAMTLAMNAANNNGSIVGVPSNFNNNTSMAFNNNNSIIGAGGVPNFTMNGSFAPNNATFAGLLANMGGGGAGAFNGSFVGGGATQRPLSDFMLDGNNNNHSGGGGGGIGDSFAHKSDPSNNNSFDGHGYNANMPRRDNSYVPLEQQFANTLVSNAIVPQAIVIGDAAYIFAYDFSYCISFRPSERTAYNDLWRRVPLQCDAIVSDLYIGTEGAGADGTDEGAKRQQRVLLRLQKRRERQQRREASLAAGGGRGGALGNRGVSFAKEELVSESSVSSSSSDDEDEDAIVAHSTLLFENPQLPLPNSIAVPLYHPTMKECLIVVSPDNRVYGCCVAPRPMQGYVGGCWKYIRLMGLELGQGPVVWAHLVDHSTIYGRSAERHFTASIAPLIEEMLREYTASKDVLGAIAAGDDDQASLVPSEMVSAAVSRRTSQLISSARRRSTVAYNSVEDFGVNGRPPPQITKRELASGAYDAELPSGAVRATPRNVQRLKPGNASKFGGTIMDYNTAVVDVHVKMLKSEPPTEKLVALPYPGLAYTTHPRERKDRVTGEVISDEQYEAHEVFTRQQARVAAELKRVGGDTRRIPVGINLFAKYSHLTQQSSSSSSSPSKQQEQHAGGGGRNAANTNGAIRKEDEELGDYYYDYDVGRYVRKQRNVKNRNILLTEAHTWLWLYNPVARNFLPWQRIDGLLDPLPVMLHNHLKGPEELATLAGDTFTTFLFGEEVLQVSRDLDDPRARQEFLKVKAKARVVEAPPPHQIKLFERERRREEALSRTKASGHGTRMSELHIREQMRLVKEQRLKAAHAAGRRALARERALLGEDDEDGGKGGAGDANGDGFSTVNTSYMGKLGPQFLEVKDDGKQKKGPATTVGGASTVGVDTTTGGGGGPNGGALVAPEEDEDPFVAAAKALATKPLQDRASCEKGLSKMETSLHIKTRRKEVALAIPMTNRRAAIVSSDFRTYVVVELDRYAHAKKYREYGKRIGADGEVEEEEEYFEL